MKKISKIVMALVWLICLGIGVIYSNSISLKENSNTVADSGTDIGTGASAITVRLHGLGVINTGLSSSITLKESLPLPIVVQSNVLNLTPGKTYILVFDYVTTGPKNKFRVDLYPDSLPEIEVEAKYPINHVQWDIKSNSNDMKNCRLRFFDSSKNDGDEDISISSIKLLDIDENKTMTYRVEVGLKFGSSLPTISKDGYVFGWYTSNGTQIKYDTVVTDNMHNLDLYPRWDEKTPESVSLNKTTLSLGKDKSETLVATVKPSDVINKSVTWKSNNTSVATVNSSGKVTGKARGTANITVTTSNGKSATCVVRVAKEPNPITVKASQSLTFTYSTADQTNAITAATNAQGTVTYSIKSQPSGNYFSISDAKLTMKKNTPAGSYTVKVLATATPPETSIYDIGSKEITISVIVNKASNSVTITPKTYTYDGSGKVTTATAISGTPSVVYYSDSSCNTKTTTTNGTSSGGTPKLVGTYYAIATVSENANYKEAKSKCEQAVTITTTTGKADVYLSGDKYKGEWIQYNLLSDFKNVTIPSNAWNNIKNDSGIVWSSNRNNIYKFNNGYNFLVEGISIGQVSILEGRKNNKTIVKLEVTVKAGKSKVTIIDNGKKREEEVTFGSTIGSLPILTKSGYKHKGYMTSEFGRLISEDYRITTNKTVYPQWFRTALQSGAGFKETTRYGSQTIEYWIEHSTNAYPTHNSSNLYLTHVWIKDPANQIKIAQGGGTTFGNKRPVNLMQAEINRLNYASKGLVAINSSFFNDSNYGLWKSYQSTPVIIHEGRILRDDSATIFENGRSIKWYDAYGITSDGQIKYYNMPWNSSDVNYNINARIHSKEQMINDGVVYSSSAFTSVPRNYSGNDTSTTRVAVCIINENVFTLITGAGMNISGVANLAYNKLECQRVLVLDGGGSTALLYKKANSGIETTDFNSGRELADMLYFVEK